MELVLWRHCEAESGYPDSERRLSETGERHAQRMAAWLRTVLPDGIRVIASPALRAQQTARTYSPAFESDASIGTGAAPEDVLAAARWPGPADDVLLVGHQPTLGAAVALALTGRATSLAIPAGAIWWLSRTAESRDTVIRAVMTPAVLESVSSRTI